MMLSKIRKSIGEPSLVLLLLLFLAFLFLNLEVSNFEFLKKVKYASLNGGVVRLSRFLLVYFAVLTSVFALIVLVKNRFWKVFFFILFALSLMTEKGIFLAYGKSGLSALEINNALIDWGLTKASLTSFFDDKWLVDFASIAVALWLVFHLSKVFQFKQGRVIAAASLFLITGAAAASFHYTASRFNSFPGSVKLPLLFAGHFAEKALTPERSKVLPVPSGSHQVGNIILIVDESIRSDFLSINNPVLDTTPYLASMAGKYANFGMMSAGSTCSYHSNLLLNSLVAEEDILDRGKVASAPTIFAAAKQAGYRTYLIDFISRLRDGLRVEDLEDIDYYLKTNELYPDSKPLERDELGLKVVQEHLQNSEGKNFVYIVKHGAHFHYENSYPQEMKFYKPSLSAGSHYKGNYHRMLNSYKNSVRFNVDEYWKHVFDLNLQDFLILYTSDHGQYFTDSDVYNITHCGDMNDMAVVPFLAYGSEENLKAVVRRFEGQRDRLSHFQLREAVLSFMGYEATRLQAGL